MNHSMGPLRIATVSACLCLWRWVSPAMGGLCAVSCAWIFAQDPEPTLVLEHGRVFSESGDWIDDGFVVIAGEKIVSVGTGRPDVPESVVPENVKRIDATGWNIVPGLIDAQSRLWMADSAQDPGASDGSLRAADGLDPFQEDWQDVLLGGVTTVYVSPSSRGTMSGLGAAVGVVPNSDGTLAILSDRAALQMSLGGARNNRERTQRYEALKKSLQGLKDYKKKWDEYEAYEKKQAAEKEAAEKKAAEKKDTEKKDTGAPAANTGKQPEGPSEGAPPPASGAGSNPVEGSRNGPGRGQRGRPGGFRRGPGAGEPASGPSPTQGEPPAKESISSSNQSVPNSEKEKAPAKPDRDPIKDRLIGVLEGKIPIRIQVRDSNDYRYAAQLWEEFSDFQWIVEGVEDLQSASKLLAEKHPALILGPWLDVSADPLATSLRIDVWKPWLRDYPGNVSLGTYSTTGRASGWLREHMAAAVASGMDSRAALKSVTINAARAIGVADQTGSLAVGKRADLIGTAGDPCDPSSPVALVIAAGKIIRQPQNGPPQLSTIVAPEMISIPARMPERYRIRSKRVYQQGQFRPASLSIQGAKIVAMDPVVEGGSNPDWPTFDVGEALITPGMFSSLADLGLGDATRGGVDSDSLFASASDWTLDGTSQQLRLAQEGIYRLALAPSSANTLSGMVGVVSTDPDSAVDRADAAAKIALHAAARRPDRFPSSLPGQVKLVRETLLGQVTPSRLFVPDEALALMAEKRLRVAQELVGGKKTVVIHVADDSELQAAVQLMEKFQLRAALTGALRWKPWRERIAKLGGAIIVQPLTTDAYPALVEELVDCHRAGIPLYFGGDSATQLRSTAGVCVRAGVAESAVGQGLFEGASHLYGLPETVDRLIPGGQSDLVIWDAVPWNLAARPLHRIRHGKTLIQEVAP